MRAVKFRAWDIDDKKLVNVNDIIFEPRLYINGETSNIEIMQYTGLKDKNGVEIYEGDIVKDSQRTRPEIVYFRDGCYVIGHKGEQTQYDKAARLWGDYCEVIGNIYEHEITSINKELLK